MKRIFFGLFAFMACAVIAPAEVSPPLRFSDFATASPVLGTDRVVGYRPPGGVTGANRQYTIDDIRTYILGGVSGSGYAQIQDEGSNATVRTTVNFIGAGISAADNSGSSRTDVTVTQQQEIGFGVDGGGSIITTGARAKRVMMYPCTITGWAIVADQSGSITMDIRKGTPSGGSVTTSSITASATPALSSQQVNTSTTLTGWTTSVAPGDVLELVVTGSVTSCTAANIVLKITR